MKGPREARKIINILRSRAAKFGKKNGGTGWIDNPWLERLLKSKKRKDDTDGTLS